MRSEAKRMWDRLETLGRVGRTAAQGLSRLAYTAADKEAQKLMAGWMTEAGLRVYRDSVGNLFGRLEGRAKDRTIMVGSHLDTVRDAGLFDGAVGVVVALEAVAALAKHCGQPAKNLEVVVTCEEEGIRFEKCFVGSRALVEGLTDAELDAEKDASGISLRQAMTDYGLDPRRVREAMRSDIEAFLEVHIEQGRVLEAAGVSLGIVTATAGQIVMEVEVLGRQDHAGATPMDLRIDSLACAARMMGCIEEYARALGRPAVATVGKIHVEPGAVNVIPGKTRFHIDARDGDPERQAKLKVAIEGICTGVAVERGCEVRVKTFLDERPVRMSSDMINLFKEVADAEKIRWLEIASGATHDAMVMARRLPTGMLFIPSRNGRSHCPEEYSDPEHILGACKVMTEALRRLAY